MKRFLLFATFTSLLATSTVVADEVIIGDQEMSFDSPFCGS